MSDPFASDLFKHAPEEVQRFFDAKSVKPSFHYKDFAAEEHAHALTVAKSTGYDILNDVKAALSEAIKNREDFDVFRAKLEPILRAKGWWGKSTERDPLTGEMKEVQLGSVRRLKTIYWANVNSAYAAGEWERIWRTREDLPFLEYLISTALHKRLEHLEWVGTILPVEDDWWSEHYPPSAWRCQCRVRQLSDYAAKKRGYDPDNPPERPMSFGRRDFVNKRTGEVRNVPVGVDPSWATNPGMTRQQTAADFLVGKLDAMSDDMRRIAVEDLSHSFLAKRIASGEMFFTPGDLDPANVSRGQIATPVAALPRALADRLDARSQVVRLSVADRAAMGAAEDIDLTVVQKLIDGGVVTLDESGALILRGVIGGEAWTATLRRGDAADAVMLVALGRDVAE